MPWIKHLLVLVNALLPDRSRLALENAALRQQIVVLKRSATRRRLAKSKAGRVKSSPSPTSADSTTDTLALRRQRRCEP